MVNYWKSKVLPSIKKVFENPKKALGVEACKVFDEAKEGYSQECEEKKAELQPKVVEVYEASPPEVKSLIKAPKDSGLKKNSAAVTKFFDELAKIEFPGSKAVSEACAKTGPAYLSGPITFVFEKVVTFLPEEKVEEVVAPPPAEEKAVEEETSGVETKEKEIVVEEPVVEAAKPAEPACEPAAKVEEPIPAPAPAPAPAPVAAEAAKP